MRQPKVIQQETEKHLQKDDVNVILTLKGDRSLVISSDSYHGIIKGREMFRCVFCKTEMEPDSKLKEAHKASNRHRCKVESYPHVEEYAENLIRKVKIDLTKIDSISNVHFAATKVQSQHFLYLLHVIYRNMDTRIIFIVSYIFL